MTQRFINPWLVVGAGFSAAAALVHLGCIVFSADWYRALGAGDTMARMAAAGHWYPPTITSLIAATLFVWALYALSGAGAIGKLPLQRAALCFITAIYLLRGVAFPLLFPAFPHNSLAFWLASSAICLLIGGVHFIGVRPTWARL